MADLDDAELRQLKYELKAWERRFATTHDGRKATKADIKEDACIAAKYRQYSQLSRSAKDPQATLDIKTTQNDLNQAGQTDIPSKPRSIFISPRKTPGNSEKVMTWSPTPQAIRLRLGPTPQKDGQILGLFDIPHVGTPSRSRAVLLDTDANVAATPSRSATGWGISAEETENVRPSRTPTSSGKRFMLDAFATPLKRRRDEVAQSPSITRDVHSTPQFLRRTNTLFTTQLDTLPEASGDMTSKDHRPIRKKGLTRSFSSMIQGLRDQEKDKADEDLELLRELENDLFEPVSKTHVTAKTRHDDEASIERVLDTQGELPLGPDTLAVTDEELSDPGGLDARGQPRKVWKKKGLKRQTKRVIMRPRPASKPEPAPITDLMDFSSAKDDHSEHEADGVDSDSSASDPKPGSGKGKTAAAAGPKDAGSDGPPKKVKKVSATANANYCRLKIKNKNSKANGRGRFGRR